MRRRGLIALAVVTACGPDVKVETAGESGSATEPATTSSTASPTAASTTPSTSGTSSTGPAAACGDGVPATGEFCFEKIAISEVSNISALAAGDLTGDGNAELAALYVDDVLRALRVAHCREAPYFVSDAETTPGRSPIVIGAFHGQPELGLLDASQGSVLVSHAFGGGTLSPATSEPIVGGSFGLGTAVDVAGDALDELYILGGDQDESWARLYALQGENWTSDGTDYPFIGVMNHSPAAVVEFAGGSLPSLVAAVAGAVAEMNYDPAVHELVVYDTASSPLQEVARYPAGVIPERVLAGDLDGDDRQDVAVVGTDGSVSILLGSASGELTPAVVLESVSTVTALGLGDFDGDGDDELVIEDGGLAVLDDPLSVAESVPIHTDEGAKVAVGDFNDDGVDDVGYEAPDSTLAILVSSP